MNASQPRAAPASNSAASTANVTNATTPAVPAPSFRLDGVEVPFTPGQSILQAALQSGRHIPHLCFHPEFVPHGSCKVCTVRVDGRDVSSCTFPAQAGQTVASNTPELEERRRQIVRMLFVEGNHFCPGCEKSGQCELQALGYEVGMATPHYPQFFPARPLDASHPEFVLDLNRCILCELCVRASRDVDGKHVFAIAGRGRQAHLVVNAASGQLADTNFTATDRAASVCPVGVILKKRTGFAVPIGQRRFDRNDIPAAAVQPDSATDMRALG